MRTLTFSFPQAALRGAFLLVDDWNLTDKLKKRASVMKSFFFRETPELKIRHVQQQA